jgi:LytS/YehU family sensor histidine kinase
MPPMSRNFVFVLILVYLIVGLVSFVSILNYNFKTLTKNKALENKILDAQLKIKDQELHYLKKQIHPHFLFNSLNTIYGFSLKKSEQTPDVILKLSNLLDYILYQVQQPKVSLQQELKHIEDYISLEQIRFQDTLKTKISNNSFSPNLEVPPMLFLPFVENAFKHGAILNGFLQIEMFVNVQETFIEFELKNTIKSKTLNKGNGLGLPTIRKRLDLLYPDHYELNSKVVDDWYIVNLKLHTNV